MKQKLGPKWKHFFSLTLSRNTIHQQCWPTVEAMQRREMGLCPLDLIFSMSSNKQPHKHNLGAYKTEEQGICLPKGKKSMWQFCSGVRIHLHCLSLLLVKLGMPLSLQEIKVQRANTVLANSALSPTQGIHYKEEMKCWRICILPHTQEH